MRIRRIASTKASLSSLQPEAAGGGWCIGPIYLPGLQQLCRMQEVCTASRANWNPLQLI